MYPPAQRELSRHDVPYARREATLLSKEDYNRFDIFALMDERNLRNISRIFTSDPEGKVCKLMSFTGNPRDVSDPWYSGDFATAYNDIERGVACAFNDARPDDVICALGSFYMYNDIADAVKKLTCELS